VATPSGTCPVAKPCGGPAGGAGCTCPDTPACDPPGAANAKTCTGNDVITCAADSNGCQQATRTTCPTGKPCAGASPDAACTCPPAPSACLVSGTFSGGDVCEASGTAVDLCMSDPTNGCPIKTLAMTCPSPQTCQGVLPSAGCACPVVTPTCAGFANGARCSGASTLVTCSASGACQQSASTSCVAIANEQCTGSFPNAKCEKAYGYGMDLGGTGTLGPGLMFGETINVAAPITVTRIGFITRAASMHVRLAIYLADGTGGAPKTWMASALPPTLTVASGRNEFAVNDPPATTPVVLAAGTYWVFGVFDASTMLAQGATATPVRYTMLNPWNTPFPTTAPTTTPDNLAAVNFYVVGVP
jgi:hypothetical protein